jgi:hypothetical protein
MFFFFFLLLLLWYLSSFLDHGLPDCRGFETVEFLRGKDASLTIDLNMEGQDVSVWHLAENLSGMGGCSCSFAATGIACKLTDAYELHHPTM